MPLTVPFSSFHLVLFKYLALIEIKAGTPALAAAAAAPVARSLLRAQTQQSQPQQQPMRFSLDTYGIFLMGLSLFPHHDAHPGNTSCPLIFPN